MKQELPFLQVFFDIDGTLLLAGGVGRRVIENIVQERYGIQNALRDIRLHGNTDPRILEETARTYAPENIDVFVAYLKTRFLECMPQAINGNCRLLPYVQETLQRLHIMGVPLGIVTGNYLECAEAKLQDTNIRNYFTLGLYTATLHSERMEILRIAINETGVPPERTLYVGDTPWDVQAAHACGCSVLALTTSLYSAGRLTVEGAHGTAVDMRVLAFGKCDFLFKRN